MLTWTTLNSLGENDLLYRGAVFRFRARTPVEEIREYMLFETSEASGLGLVRCSGYDAGHVLVYLPEEAKAEGARAISPKWLASHWLEWIGHSIPSQVWVSKEAQESPERLPDE
ncbi:Imm45 family immunity protein [Mesorhizobium sp. M0816]|uniref:Imm45 family immunity protein n=1 Tax=Mesorhizobium sp. M0816 TaxID=2957006 RepID=UPI00333B9F1D